MKEKGHLASVSSEQVHKYLQGKKTSGWIGGAKEDWDNPVNKDSKWVWTDCSKWDLYSDWAPLEPNNNGGEENCVEFLFATQHWNDRSCADKDKFVCSKTICPGTKTRTQVIEF